MPREAGDISFRPVRDSDLPLLSKWLGAPHVAAWWDAPQEGVRKIADHIGNPTVDPLLVELDGEAFAYIQVCQLDLERDSEPWLDDQPEGVIGIDQFIGPAKLTGRGLGPRLMQAMIKTIFEEGAPRVLVDPDPCNVNAIRAYEKTGFRRIGAVETKSGPALIMAIDRQEFMQ